MRAKEMHAKTNAELAKHIAKLRDKNAQLSREKYLGDAKATKDLRTNRKELARALTIAQEKTVKTAKEAA